MNLRLLLILLLISQTSLSQRTLTNPVILVHGWTGDYSTWNTFTNYLETQASLSIERNYLNYNLNCDNNLRTSDLRIDVCDNTVSLGNKDVYIINFNSGNLMSNQSAAVKQGYALRFAINNVLKATNAEKVVLLGHSMGGLAIREYLQNPSNWQSDGQHHIAKMITIGTPHSGSDFGTSDFNLGAIFSNKDEESEAVRDLRSNYKSGYKGVYLFGGFENSTYITRGFLSLYYNLDVNCNGRSGDFITGLNEKNIYTNLDFSCIIGGPTNDDVIVSTYSQNLNNLYKINAELFYYNCNSDILCHSNEPKKAILQMIQGLDEPNKYPTNIKFGPLNKGFFTLQSNGNNVDNDDYSIFVPQRGVISFNASSVKESNSTIKIFDPSGNLILNSTIGALIKQSIPVSLAGYYKISIEGNSQGVWSTYNFSFGFCNLPIVPNITASGLTSFCEGQTLNLSTVSGYDEYNWYKDGVKVENNSNQLTVSQSGTFTLQVLKCGILSNSTNSILTIAKPLPIKPIISKEEKPDIFLLTSSSSENNQWYLNGNTIVGETSQTYVPQNLGSYTVSVTKDGCYNTSDILNVKMDKPEISIVGPNPFCDGDSVKLITKVGFESYIFSDGLIESISKNNEQYIKKSGSYSVITKRGKFISTQSDPISIQVNPKPPKPTIYFGNMGFKSDSPINNQWYLNGIAITDSIGQFINSIGPGLYSVRVTENGCFSESEAFTITSIEPGTKSIPINLYPNPNDGTFWVEIPQIYSKWKIEIYNLQGKQIYDTSLFNPSNNIEKIKIKGRSGTYILKVITEESTQSTKFVID